MLFCLNRRCLGLFVAFGLVAVEVAGVRTAVVEAAVSVAAPAVVETAFSAALVVVELAVVVEVAVSAFAVELAFLLGLAEKPLYGFLDFFKEAYLWAVFVSERDNTVFGAVFEGVFFAAPVGEGNFYRPWREGFFFKEGAFGFGGGGGVFGGGVFRGGLDFFCVGGFLAACVFVFVSGGVGAAEFFLEAGEVLYFAAGGLLCRLCGRRRRAHSRIVAAVAARMPNLFNLFSGFLVFDCRLARGGVCCVDIFIFFHCFFVFVRAYSCARFFPFGGVFMKARARNRPSMHWLI